MGSIVYAAGVANPLNVPASDYTLSFDLISLQTIITGGTSPVVAGYGAFGPLGNVTVRVNGNRRPFSLSGWQADQYTRVRENPYASQLTSNPVTISSTVPWVNHLHVPLTISEDTERGCWYSGDTEAQMTLAITGGAATQTFSTVNAATIQGSWDVWREAFSAPAPDQPGGWLDAISWYHELVQQGTVNLSNGTVPFDLPRDLDYMRIWLFFYTGADTDGTFAPADGLYSSVDFVLNDKIHIWDNVTEAEIRFEQLLTNGIVLSPGVAVLDMVRLKTDTGLSRRDVLPTDSANITHAQLKITSTSASNKCDVVTETVSDNPFAARWIRQAAANAGKPATA
jgi:hypothetical protein